MALVVLGERDLLESCSLLPVAVEVYPAPSANQLFAGVQATAFLLNDLPVAKDHYAVLLAQIVRVLIRSP